jgi:fructose-1,6-bisphosphatase
MHSQLVILESNYSRIRVIDTDEGKRIQGHIQDLTALLEAYRSGVIKENLPRD